MKLMDWTCDPSRGSWHEHAIVGASRARRFSIVPSLFSGGTSADAADQQPGLSILRNHSSNISMPENTTVRPSVLLLAALLTVAACGSDKAPTDPGNDDPPRPTSIALSRGSISLGALGDSTRLTATVKDQQGAALAAASVNWSSTDTAIAKVNANGWTFAVSNGTARIVAVSGTVADTATVEVAQVPAAIEVGAGSVTLGVGDTTRLGATVLDSNDVAIEGAALTWTSTNPATATVDEAGLISGVGAGETQVIASAGEVADTVAVTVTPASGAGPGTGGPAPATVTATPSHISLEAVEDSAQATVVVRDGDGAELTGASVIWSTTDVEVATVSTDGWVKAIANGSTRAIVRAGSVADTITIEVSQVPASLTVSVDSAQVGEGGTIQLSAEARDRNGFRYGGMPVIWSSASTSIATVDYTGLVTGKWRGAETTVTAKLGDQSVTVPIRVMDQIVFKGLGGAIYLVHEDGSGEKTLLASGGSYPAWSPDGTKIAYLEGSGLNQDVWVMNADGTGKTQLTNDKKSGRPAWSPDGKQIVFTSSRHAVGAPAVYLMNADGTGQTRVSASTEAENFPVWSPNGQSIAFIRTVPIPGTISTQSEIFIVKPDGTGEVQVTNHTATDFYPVWSPDGKTIAFYSDREGTSQIYRYDVAARTTSKVAGNLPTRDHYYPEWSPDGSRIVFHETRTGVSQIVTRDPFTGGFGQVWAAHPGAHARYGRWSPDGKKILYSVADTDKLHLWHRTEPIGGLTTVTSKADTGGIGQHAWRPRQIIFIPPIIFP
jgi:TolB protein